MSMRENMRYKMVFDTGDCVDSIGFETFEEAQADALDTLVLWMTEFCNHEKCSINLKEWTQKQIDEWDYMIYNCSVEVRDKERYNDEDFGEIWEPSDEELKEIGWVLYEEMKQGFD